MLICRVRILNSNTSIPLIEEGSIVKRLTLLGVDLDMKEGRLFTNIMLFF